MQGQKWSAPKARKGKFYVRRRRERKFFEHFPRILKTTLKNPRAKGAGRKKILGPPYIGVRLPYKENWPPYVGGSWRGGFLSKKKKKFPSLKKRLGSRTSSARKAPGSRGKEGGGRLAKREKRKGIGDN